MTGDATQEKISVKKKRSRPRSSKGWCFTWFQENINLDELAAGFEERKFKYTIGRETCPTTGKKHIQGFIKPAGRSDFATIQRLLPGAHVEAVKGSLSENDAYCRKDGDYRSNIEAADGDERSLKRRCQNDALSRFTQADWKWRDWQQRLLDTISNAADGRRITWYYDNGNTGKTTLFKYLVCRDDGVVFIKGTEKDIALQVEKMMTVRKQIPKVCIANLPRAKRNHVSYAALESLKDGLVFSTKYEGSDDGACVFPSPHVIVFANFEPERTLLSEDRWEIINLDV